MYNFKDTLLDWLSRKMVVFYLSLTALFILTFTGKLAGDNFMIGLGWIVSAVIVGNIGEWKYKNPTSDTTITSK